MYCPPIYDLDVGCMSVPFPGLVMQSIILYGERHIGVCANKLIADARKHRNLSFWGNHILVLERDNDDDI